MNGIGVSAKERFWFAAAVCARGAWVMVYVGFASRIVSFEVSFATFEALSVHSDVHYLHYWQQLAWREWECIVMTVTCLGSRKCCLLACDEPCITDKSLTKCMGADSPSKGKPCQCQTCIRVHQMGDCREDIFVKVKSQEQFAWSRVFNPTQSYSSAFQSNEIQIHIVCYRHLRINCRYWPHFQHSVGVSKTVTQPNAERHFYSAGD